LLTIRHLLETEALANSNATKVGELEDALFGALHDLIGDRTVATAVFEEDEIPTLEAACKRIGLLLSFRPAVAAMEETEGETATGWSLLLDLANRGSLGYQEEATVRRCSASRVLERQRADRRPTHAVPAQLVEECLESLTRFVFHRARTADSEPAQQSLVEKRAALLELLEEFTIGTQSNAVETVRRTVRRTRASLR
jgi:cohesin complex subunit SA-1/2